MHAGIHRALAITAVMALAPQLFAQIQSIRNVAGSSAGLGLGVVPDRPQSYTVEFNTINVQTLADGTTITTETKEMVARDSEGRSMSSTIQPAPFAEQKTSTWGRVDNPVENLQVDWNSQTKQATVIKLPPQDQRRGCWTSDSHRMSMNYGPFPPPAPTAKDGSVKASASVQRSPRIPHPEVRHEDLGTTMIEGVEAKGDRFTTITSIGEVGNDRELVSTNEVWMATGLGLNLREIRNNPRSGKSAREVVSLTLGEPDLSLFQPPEGYEVVTDEMHEVPCTQ